MGSCGSCNKTKAPNQEHMDRPPDTDKAHHKQVSSHLKRKKTKIVLVFHLNKGQQLAQARPGRQDEDVLSALAGSPVAVPVLRGAGDGVYRREGARARERKRILVLLLQQDDRPLEEGCRGACTREGGAEAAASGPLLSQGGPREGQPRRRRRSPRPRP